MGCSRPQRRGPGIVGGGVYRGRELEFRPTGDYSSVQGSAVGVIEVSLSFGIDRRPGLGGCLCSGPGAGRGDVELNDDAGDSERIFHERDRLGFGGLVGNGTPDGHRSSLSLDEKRAPVQRLVPMKPAVDARNEPHPLDRFLGSRKPVANGLTRLVKSFIAPWPGIGDAIF